MNMTYEQEFQVFQTNINFAARAFYYSMAVDHLSSLRNSYNRKVQNAITAGFNAKILDYNPVLMGLNATPRFWLDYRYMCTLSFVMALGRIFDRNKKSHGLGSLFKAAKRSGAFTLASLRERKTNLDNTKDWSGYMSNAHELSKEDCKEIIKFTIMIRKKWKVIKPIRNKILAHQEKLEEGKILEILKKGQYDRFEEIIQDLLTLENIFQGAFLNGTKPDYDFKNSWVKSEREEEVKRLFKLLQGTPKTP
jgi:hypothetical protein